MKAKVLEWYHHYEQNDEIKTALKEFIRPPECPDIQPGFKGFGTILRHLIELRVWNDFNQQNKVKIANKGYTFINQKV